MSDGLPYSVHNDPDILAFAKEAFKIMDPTPNFDWVERRYSEFLNGQTVAIIGGHDVFNSVKARKARIHVRINSHYQRQGGRCHVLYHTCVGEPSISPADTMSLPEAKFAWLNAIDGAYNNGERVTPIYYPFVEDLRLSRPECDIGFFGQGSWMNKNPYNPTFEWLNEVHKKYDATMFTGLIALGHILRHKPASVFVCGMNLFAEPGRKSGMQGIHRLGANALYLHDLAEDTRVELDDPVKEGLRHYGFAV